MATPTSNVFTITLAAERPGKIEDQLWVLADQRTTES
jgi:hypothetical protein